MNIEDFYKLEIEDMYDVLRKAKYIYCWKFISVSKLHKIAVWIHDSKPEIQDLKAYLSAVNIKGKEESEKDSNEMYANLIRIKEKYERKRY